MADIHFIGSFGLGPVWCACGQILAYRLGSARWELRHRGRRVVFRGVIESATCERCGEEGPLLGRVGAVPLRLPSEYQPPIAL